MSQGLAMENEHPKAVNSTLLDPASVKARRRYNALSASSVGLELGVATVVGLLGGMWLDSYFGTKPWLMLILLVFGLVAGFRNVLRAVERAERAGEREDREAGHA
ncbi:MAG: AtpZ/AtpI family protein [Kofleriaceae bacterium]